MQNPTDHLLLKINEDHCWGDPLNHPEFDHETLKSVTDLGMTPLEYFGKPEIIYSEEPCTHQIDNDWPHDLFDVLGIYQVEDPIKEGSIILYEVCIRKFGLIFYEAFGKTTGHTSQFCIDMVRNIVLWHEQGHWITHWMPGRDENRWNTKSYNYNSGTKDVHEGLAQLFTHYAIINIDDISLRTDYLLLFSFMLQNQAPCYHKFLDILGHKKFGWNQCFTALTMIRIVEKADEVTMDHFMKNLYISLF
jgi:hypothetical protein